MKPSRKLIRLQRTACKRIKHLQKAARDVPQIVSPRERNIAVSCIAIEALNTWANFSRTFYLSCRLGACFPNGNSITCTVAFIDFNQAIGEAILQYHPNRLPAQNGQWNRRDEPTWHDTTVILQLAQLQSWSNISDVQAALSTGTRAFIDLPVFRNYFAHRNQGTMHAAQGVARNYVISTSRLPIDILLTRPNGRPESLIVEWLNDIETVIEFLCNPL